MLKQHPATPGKLGAPGHPQPAAPGCFLPGDAGSGAGSRDGVGGRRGLLLLPRLPEN